MTENQEN